MIDREARELWALLGEEGKPPAELLRAAHVLPDYTAGIQPWIDRIASSYLQDLCREYAHFKLVLAPYGGGKTHFLTSLGIRGHGENFAVSYVPCSAGLNLEDPLAIYREAVSSLQLPGDRPPGLQGLLDLALTNKRETALRQGASDVEHAVRQWRSTLVRRNFPQSAFGRMMSVALDDTEEGGTTVGEAAFLWLQGNAEALNRGDLQKLRVRSLRHADRKRFGQDLLLSLAKFLPESGVHGLILLLDEVETLSQVKGKALLRILAAIRVFLDLPTSVPGGVPLFGVFAATPDVLDEVKKYPALQQRLAVTGASFSEGNDMAIQLPLDKVAPQDELLMEIGQKLIDIGSRATGHRFNVELQVENARRLVHVACERNLDVAARRIFVKSWVNILQLQARSSERIMDRDELFERYQGVFDGFRSDDGEVDRFEA